MHKPRAFVGERLTTRARTAHRRVPALLSALMLCAAAVTVAPTAAQASPAAAHAALSNTYVKEQGQLHVSSRSGGAAIAAQGSASGTFDASLNIDLTIKISQISGSFIAYLKGGTISGSAQAIPHYSGQWVSFKGSLTVKHGTGRYAGASGSASLYGSLNRLQLKLNVQVIGRLRL
jgi:hypothetical protein